jgi:hypothetical protein
MTDYLLRWPIVIIVAILWICGGCGEEETDEELDD